MLGQIVPIPVFGSQAQATFVNTSGKTSLGALMIAVPLAFLIFVAYRKYHQHLIRKRVGHLERSLQQRSSSNPK